MAVPAAPTMITTMVIATTAATMREATAAVTVLTDTRVAPDMVASLAAMMTTHLQLMLQLSMLATLETRTCSALPLACSPAARHSRKTLMRTKPSDITSSSTAEPASPTQPALVVWAQPQPCRPSRCSTREAALLAVEARARTTSSVLPCLRLPSSLVCTQSRVAR